MSLAHALLVAAHTLPGPYVPPAQSETYRWERDAFLERVSDGLASAAQELTCEDGWAELDWCERRWVGSAVEAGALGLTLAWFESRIDPRIQAGDCRVYGPREGQIECDGTLVKMAPGARGIRRSSPWGEVVFRSVTIFQLRDLPWQTRRDVMGQGSASVYEASRVALGILASSQKRCRGDVGCMVASYAGSQRFKQRAERVRVYRRVLERVRSAMGEAGG